MDARAEAPDTLDRSHELLYIQATFLAVAGFCVLLRVFTKLVLIKHHSVDDYLTYAAMVPGPACAQIRESNAADAR